MAPAHRPPLSALAITGQLASPARLRVVAALVLGADSPGAIGAATGLDDDVVTTALARLQRVGLVTSDGGSLQLDERAFSDAARTEKPDRRVADFGTTDPAITRVLRAFVVDGRLASIPAAGRKRRIVLEHIASAFEPGVRYPEAQVNAILRAWHDDYAAIRRYLVEDSLLTRENGQYWRSGGWVDVL